MFSNAFAGFKLEGMRSLMLPICALLLFYEFSLIAGLMKVVLDFDRWETMNGSDIFNMQKIRVRKFNRTVSVLNGSAELLIDLDNSFEYGFSFARSAQGNGQYNVYPMKLASKPFCDFLNSYYREYQYLFLNSTNLPYIPEEGLCPFPKGKYWVKDYHLDTSVIPIVVPEGFWRCYTDLYEKSTGVLRARGAMYVRLSKEFA